MDFLDLIDFHGTEHYGFMALHRPDRFVVSLKRPPSNLDPGPDFTTQGQQTYVPNSSDLLLHVCAFVFAVLSGWYDARLIGGSTKQ